MSTLQEKYNLIKKGKGSKYTFLTESKKQFPNILTNPMGFEEASKALIRRGVINEGYVDLHPINSINNTPKSSFETLFDKFINEESKKEKSPKVEDYNKSAHDPTDKKNLDNQIGQEVLKGIYYEGRENPELTLEELRKLVSKNLEKDCLYYVKNGMFGVKDLGYQEPDSFEVSGKHKSSGYSDKTKKVVKESFDMGNIEEEKEEKQEVTKPKMKKMKKDTLETRLAEIDKQGAVVALEAKIGMVNKAIDEKEDRIKMVSEDENLSQLIEKSKIKEMQREVKVLEKRKSKMENMYEKMCGKSYSKPEMVDEVSAINEMAAGGLEEKSAGKKLFAAFKKAGLKPNYLSDVRKLSMDGEAKDMVHIEPGEGSVEISSRSNQDKIAQTIKSCGFNISKEEDNVGDYKLSVFTIDIK